MGQTEPTEGAGLSDDRLEMLHSTPVGVPRASEELPSLGRKGGGSNAPASPISTAHVSMDSLTVPKRVRAECGADVRLGPRTVLMPESPPRTEWAHGFGDRSPGERRWSLSSEPPRQDATPLTRDRRGPLSVAGGHASLET